MSHQRRWAALVLTGACLGGLTACGSSATTLLPTNVSQFLYFNYTGSNGGTVAPVDQRVEQAAGVTGYIGSHLIPGTVSVSAPNAAGAVLFTWTLHHERFQWWVAQNGQYATPTNARSAAAIGAP